jgi:hypothetical protein
MKNITITGSVTAKIKEVTMQSVVRILFSDVMVIPDDLTIFDDSILLISLNLGDDSENVNLLYWNVTYY